MREDLEVPRAVREEVIERDNSCCRVCGRHVETPALHHVRFRSQLSARNGLHLPDNLVVVGWLPWHECHLRFCHGPNAAAYREALLVCAQQPGLTAHQILRWARNRGR